MGTIGTINGRLRSRSSGGAPAKRVSRFWARVVERVEVMLEKRRSRRALLELTDQQLKDIGISRADAFREAVKPFWD